MTHRAHPRRSLLTVLALLACATPAFTQDGGSIAGRSATKRFANLGILPQPEMVVVEDIVNYHRHRLPLPKAGHQVALDLSWDAPLPKRLRESVLQIGFATPRVHDTMSLRPVRLALVIDCSGSMNSRDKIGRVRQGLAAFVQKLRPTDTVSIVTYSTEATVALPARRVGDRRAVLECIRSLTAGGGTNLHGGLMKGYAEVQRATDDGHVDQRVILLTDGRANQGVVEPDAIARDSKKFNADGIDLSTIGVGTNFNRDLLAGLAKAGRGHFHFVGDDQDIHKVFVQEAQSLVGIIAREVEVEVLHGDGIEVAKVYGYEPKMLKNGFRSRLENLNYGTTAVMMVKFRCKNPEVAATVASRVQVRLTWRDATTHKREKIDQRTRFLDPMRTDDTTDHEVRKNFTIAVLANATRRMAEAVESSRFGAAERALRDALRFYDSHYRGTHDKDLLQNRETVQKYCRILGKHIERFRRL